MSRQNLIWMLAAAIQAFKGLSGKVKMPNRVLTLVMRVERSICPFQRLDLQVAEIKD
jgi:hypothetical protein